MLASLVANATLLEASLSHNGAGTWNASFVMFNDGTLPSIESFTVYLDHDRATNLVFVSSPSTWDTQVVQPDAALNSDGFMDALLLDPTEAITPGHAQKGFSIQFDWTGAADPTAFRFTVNDRLSFAVLESGVTGTSTAQQVPEPTSWLLAGLGLLAAAGVRQSRRIRG